MAASGPSRGHARLRVGDIQQSNSLLLGVRPGLSRPAPLALSFPRPGACSWHPVVVSRRAASQVSWPQVHAVPTLCPTRNGLSAALHCSCGESVGLVVTAAKLSPSSTGGTRLAFITSTGSELTPRCSYWAAESRRRSAFVGHEGGCQHLLSIRYLW